MACFSSVIASSTRMGSDKRQASIASHAARSLLESMRCRPYRDVFEMYDSDPANDPGGAGSAPGRFFAVEGLDPVPGDPDGFVGVIELPESGGELREDLENELLGMPRDLDGDTLIDDLDHADDYEILPVRVRIEWNGPLGPRSLEMYTMLARLEVAG
jgi:hypothetical protein